jgi:DegV family protein with EDD domain
MSIRVVTDSSADLPADLLQKWDIVVVPCYVMVDDVTYKDGVDLTAEEFYGSLVSSVRTPTTAQPSPADFQAVYQDLLEQGHEIVSIHVSGKLSGTVNSAQQARAALGDSAPVEVVDSQMASLGMGLVVLDAARRASEAASHLELAQEVRECLPQTQCIFVLDTLEYLQKGGRIGKAQAFVGSVLSVKPILKLQDGEVHPVERPRNLERGIRRLAELAREYAPLRQLGVIYSTDPERAAELKRTLSDLLPQDKIVTSRFGPALGTYVGPRALGIALTRAG